VLASIPTISEATRARLRDASATAQAARTALDAAALTAERAALLPC
jgi:hypothetical protein